MAREDQDPYDQPYADSGGGAGLPPGWESLAAAVRQIYQTALGRPPESDAVVQQWIQGTGGDLAKIQQGIYGTPEAQAYSASRSAQAPKAPDPTNPNPTPAPAPAPAPFPGAPPPSAPTQAAPGAAPGGAPPTASAPPPLEAPPPFTYDPFTGPTADEILNDPDYQLTRDQGIQAIGHKNAALGTLNTGGTIGDFIGFAGNLAHAKYGDIYNRDFNTYSSNRANAFDAYKTNYGISKDVYDTNYQDQYQNPFTNNLASAGLTQNNNQFNAQLGQNNNQFNSTLDFNTWLQNYKMSVSDPFDQKYKLLGLL